MNEFTVLQIRDLFKQIMAEPERIFELVQIDLNEQCERVVNELPKAERTDSLDREPHERQAPATVRKGNYRNV